MKISGAKDGQDVELPQGLDALVIETSIGGIYIDLNSPVPEMILIRPVAQDMASRRLILSPMDSGRIAVGVIKST